jgi:hypothetical protein
VRGVFRSGRARVQGQAGAAAAAVQVVAGAAAAVLEEVLVVEEVLMVVNPTSVSLSLIRVRRVRRHHLDIPGMTRRIHTFRVLAPIRTCTRTSTIRTRRHVSAS